MPSIFYFTFWNNSFTLSNFLKIRYLLVTFVSFLTLLLWFLPLGERLTSNSLSCLSFWLTSFIKNSSWYWNSRKCFTQESQHFAHIFFIILISYHHLKDCIENQCDLPALLWLDSANYFPWIIFNNIYHVSGIMKSLLEKM